MISTIEIITAGEQSLLHGNSLNSENEFKTKYIYAIYLCFCHNPTMTILMDIKMNSVFREWIDEF